MSVEKIVSAFWWRGVVNWGDTLTPLLLKRFAHLDVEWAKADEAHIACVGSILGNLVKSEYNGIILGSGKLFENGVVPYKNSKILALRGPLTAHGVPGDYVLGDPGLLADELVNVETKKYNLGIVPHWSDKTLATDPRFAQYNPVVINPHGDALEVVRQIGECKKIVSSSLHGLIVADSFSIPRRFEATGNWQNEGGQFKVKDYNEAVGVQHEVGLTQEANWNRVADIKNNLFDAFKEFRRLAKEM
jgi:pyruvyltransferase